MKIYILCFLAVFFSTASHSIQHLPSVENAQTLTSPQNQSSLLLGAENTQLYIERLKGKKVGLVVNPTSLLFQRNIEQTELKPIHLLDFLIAHNIDVQVLFAPEHGVRGNKGAGEHIENGKDADTLVSIQSIYGSNKTPPDSLMQTLDVIVFDIQDVGTRFYTYISSMHYMMEAAAKHGVEFIVLDRPNPNGEFVDGPVLDMAFQSFVGMHPIPLLHGLTVAELAQMIKGEKWIENAQDLNLTIVPMSNYHKTYRYLLPVAPSPNLPNYQAIRLYPSLCFFEPTAVSIGRGTDFPFQVVGHDTQSMGNFHFTPVSKPHAAPKPKLMDTKLSGIDLRISKMEGLDLSLFIQYYKAFKKNNKDFYTSTSFMDKLAGTDLLRKSIEAGVSIQEIRHSWQHDLNEYREMRKEYLLYPLQKESNIH